MSINISERDRFLLNQWEKYPNAKNLKMAGRLTSIDHLHVVLVQIKQGKATSVKIPLKKIADGMDWKSILVAGDIIGISKDNQCVLLAPYRDTLGYDSKKTLEKLVHQQRWNKFIAQVSSFFSSRGFLSVNTPSLVDNPGPEPTIDVFGTEYKNGRVLSKKYLITSPELHLKKILCESLTPIYEMTKVFRNNEHSPKHQPEFWMIEWYRPFATLKDIEQDVRDLILHLIRTLKIKIKRPRFETTTFRKILKSEYGLNFEPETTASQIKEWLTQYGIYFSSGMNLDDLFSLLNLELIEKKLNSNNVVFLNDYPPYAAALAKIDKNGWAQRFEVYWRDLELGNAFYELNDPQIQEQRLIEDNIKKQINGLDPLPIDREFISSLYRGMPPSAGISVGLERLYMALYNETEIKDLKWFSLT